MTEIMLCRRGPPLHVNSSLTTPLWNRALFYMLYLSKQKNCRGAFLHGIILLKLYCCSSNYCATLKVSTLIMYKCSQSMLKKLTTVYDGWLVYVWQIILLYIGNSHYEAHMLDIAVKYNCRPLFKHKYCNC
jgi:hypothetical protein